MVNWGYNFKQCNNIYIFILMFKVMLNTFYDEKQNNNKVRRKALHCYLPKTVIPRQKTSKLKKGKKNSIFFFN